MEKDDTSQTKEICDIYDVYGNRTGKTFVRGEPLSNGQYVMVVDVWIVNSRDEILIQKRSEQKKDLPGTWASRREFYRYPEFFDVVRFLEERRKRKRNTKPFDRP